MMTLSPPPWLLVAALLLSPAPSLAPCPYVISEDYGALKVNNIKLCKSIY